MNSNFFSWLRRVLKLVLEKMRFSKFYDEPKTIQADITLKPVTFHEKHGQNIRLWINQQIAFRSYDFCKGYVFMPEAINGKEYFVVVQVLETDKSHLGGLAFGVTSEDPSDIRAESLPSNSGLLHDGRSYLVHTNVTKFSAAGDILIFHVNEKNEMSVKVNDYQEITLFSVNENTPYWWFFDVYGTTRKIRAYLAEKSEVDLLGLQAQQPELFTSHQNRNDVSETGTETSVASGVNNSYNPKLTLTCYLTKKKIWYEPIRTNLRSEQTVNSGCTENIIIEDPSVGYCIECFKNPFGDCMLYPCGHFILCYNCALELKHHSEHNRCPKCLLIVENFSRIFR